MVNDTEGFTVVNANQRYLLMICVTLFLAGHVAASVNRGQSTLTWLTISGSPRDAAIGGTAIASKGDAGTAMSNPAGISSIRGANAHLNVTHWLAGMSVVDFAGAYRLTRTSVAALNFRSMNYGDFEFTRIANNPAGYIDIPDEDAGTLGGYSTGIAIAGNLTPNLTAGARLSYVRDRLGAFDIVQGNGDTAFAADSYISATLLDFGTVIQTGWRTLELGMALQNAGRRHSVSNRTDSFLPPTVFQVGISADVLKLAGISQTPFEAETRFEVSDPHDGVHVWNAGTEIAYRTPANLYAAIRGGWRGRQTGGLTLGVGFGGPAGHTVLAFNYAWTDYGPLLGTVNRVGLCVSF